MRPADRERAVSYLAQTRDNLLRATSGLSPSQLQFKPSPGRWSVSECLEHLIAVENRILESISSALGQPADSSKRSAFDGRDDELLQVVTDRTSRREAPEPVQPSNRWPHDQLIREFEAARKRSIELAATTECDPRRHFFAHRAFGDLDCYQWMLLVAAHGDRHRAQIEDVLAAPNFPRASGA
ncbi:MAG: DinB family protein [Acidobacteriota bacterium]|nr:DinB family protein [Acidobacteriota bacterium]MDE3170923.1 DinB family protein [Acidobacteriota bacterium]